MDIRTVGQRHSYAEAPDSSFYQTFQSAFAAASAIADGGATGPGTAGGQAGPTSSEALEAILGRTHTELSALRGVGADSQAVYAKVLDKAYASGAMSNARQFLSSLSAGELEAVRGNHCLAEPIDVAGISEEGARNLLLPEGYCVGLNGDVMTYGLMMHDAVYGLHIDGQNTPSPYKADDTDS